MKLVHFKCTVVSIRAEVEGKDAVEPHDIYINPDDVQMLSPFATKEKTLDNIVYITYCNDGGSTAVEGSFAEVIEKLTSA